MTSSHLPQPHHQESNEEVDLNQVIAALSRHRRLIGSVTAIAFLLSVIFAFFRKPVWEGQFQIVLVDKTSLVNGGQSLQSNPGLANLIGLNNGSAENTLETEVRSWKALRF